MPKIIDNELVIGHLVTYCGQLSNWDPMVAIERNGRLERAGVHYRDTCLFSNIRDAVYWARDHGFYHVTLPVTYMRQG